MKPQIWFGLAVSLAVAAGSPVWAQTAPATDAPAVAAPAVAPTGPRKEGDDMVLGRADAPITIIEYASLTCPHCANFHSATLPQIKAEYIDKGHVKLVYRDFPLDRLALAGAMVARCAGPERYFGFLDVLFRQQGVWARSADPRAALGSIARQGGMSSETFETCLANQEIQTAVLTQSLQGEREFQVQATPTIIINGKKHAGGLSFEDLDRVLRPLVPKG